MIRPPYWCRNTTLITVVYLFLRPKKDAVYEYGIVYLKDSFYIVGGYWKTKGQSGNQQDEAEIPSIARLDTKTFWSWSLAGKLNTARAGHSAIVANSRLIVVGGRVSDL